MRLPARNINCWHTRTHRTLHAGMCTRTHTSTGPPQPARLLRQSSATGNCVMFLHTFHCAHARSRSVFTKAEYVHKCLAATTAAAASGALRECDTRAYVRVCLARVCFFMAVHMRACSARRIHSGSNGHLSSVLQRLSVPSNRN